MTPLVQFLLIFGATVALLLGAFWAGLRHRRKLHLALVAATLIGLGGSIWLAVRAGAGLRFDPLAQGIHRTFSTSMLVLLGPMIYTGVSLLRSRAPARRWHRLGAIALLTVAGLAAVTGLWMMSTGARV